MEQRVSQDAEIAVGSWSKAIAATAPLLRQHAVVTVPADSAGWIDAGVEVRRGESVSLLVTGAAHPAGVPQMKFAPSLFLCYRVRPHGHAAKLPASTMAFTADADGRLEFVAQFPGAWADRNGTLDPAWPRNAAAGRYTVAVLVWAGAADEGLALFAAHDAADRVPPNALAWPRPCACPRAGNRCGAPAQPRCTGKPRRRRCRRASCATAAVGTASSSCPSTFRSTNPRAWTGAGA